MGKRWATVLGVAVAGVMALGVAACGGDDDEETTDASAEEVTVTTSDTADGFSWDVSATPTAETTSVTLKNESEEGHGLVFARLGEGYTVDEAYELQGKKGSATDVIRSTGSRPWGIRDRGRDGITGGGRLRAALSACREERPSLQARSARGVRDRVAEPVEAAGRPNRRFGRGAYLA